MAEQMLLLNVPILGLYPMDVDDANALLIAWQHRLGACKRPFGQQAFCLRLQGEAIRLAVSTSIVSTTVAGYHRDEVVESARLCSALRYAEDAIERCIHRAPIDSLSLVSRIGRKRSRAAYFRFPEGKRGIRWTSIQNTPRMEDFAIPRSHEREALPFIVRRIKPLVSSATRSSFFAYSARISGRMARRFQSRKPTQAQENGGKTVGPFTVSLRPKPNLMP